MAEISVAPVAPCDFETTQWSVIRAAQKQGTPGAAEALQTLCLTYWYPLYAFIRRRLGDNHEEAADLVQGFFGHLLKRECHALQKVNPEKGRFRSFLMKACSHFVSNERDKRGAQKRCPEGGIVPLQDAEGRYLLEPSTGETAEAIFDRRWALALLQAALAALRKDYAGREAVFDSLKEFLLVDGTTPSYAEKAGELSMPEGTVRKAVFDLRQRYRECLEREIARTLDQPTAEEIREEVRDLFAALQPSRTGTARR
jgi:RNA polymerase sigma-70 factor (ECF subfamily)